MKRSRSAYRAGPARIAALAAATMLAGTGAQAQVTGRFKGDASLRGGYASNPFLTSDEDAGSPYAEFVLAPSYTLTDATSATEINGTFRLTKYFEGYDDSESYSVNAIHRHQFDEFTDANLSIMFDSSVLGEQEVLLGVPGEPDFPEPVDPGAPRPPGDDIPLIGSGQRSTLLSASGSLTRRISAFDSVSVNGGASRTWYDSNFANDFRNYDASASYSRTISERSTVGFVFSASWTDYEAAPTALPLDLTSDTAVYSPRLTYSRRLSSALSLDASVGAQFIKRTGGIPDSNGFSGSLTLCRTDTLSSVCLTASQDAASSGIGGVRQQTSFNLSSSYRLGEYDSIRANLSYSRYGGQENSAGGDEYWNADAAWERRLGERLLGGASLAYRNVSGAIRSGSTDVNAQIFIRYTLGQLR